MDFSRTAIFSDLDGTLFSDDRTISDENLLAVKRYTEEGGVFALSTGRIPSNLRHMLDGLIVNGTSIVANGSGLYNFKKHKYIIKKKLNSELVNVYIEYIMDGFKSADIIIYAGDNGIFVTPHETAEKDFVDTHLPCFFQNLSEVEGNYLKVLINDKHENLEKIRDIANNISKRFNDSTPFADLVFTNSNYLEVLPPGANKGSGLEAARKLPEYIGKTIFAIGDFYNDIELLDNANIACAPANSLLEVKKKANIITNDNNHSAIADLIQFIEKF